ncbi:MAG: hypothetical protein V7K72_29245 [Nostoc sp.]|uniref:hypothetical protein n=1 Tax=Nostoc sp. TaxID=1180 RepID=UPI002FF8A4B5
MLLTENLQTGEQIHKEISDILSQKFEVHPFSRGVTLENLEIVLKNYLAMSQAFPYLQAGSQKELIFDCIDKDTDVNEHIEITSVVGNFLCWDETGGHYILLKHGITGLPIIIDTKQYFHSNLLKKDIQVIFGKVVEPSYSQVTREYLYNLYQGLSSLDSIVRCASMVAFEIHAGQMIDVLWQSISAIFPLQKDSLFYFRTHVGGTDPAEPYHIQMTSRMIEKIVSENQIGDFLKAFENAYALNYFWCRDITKIQ